MEAITISTQVSSKNISPTDKENDSESRWFINPTIDILFCCGGALWILIACHFIFNWSIRYPTDGPGVYAGSIAALIGVICFSDAHVSASLFRFYGQKRLRDKNYLVSYLVPSILFCLGCASLFYSEVLALGLRTYLIFITHHLAWQTYGIALRYCKKQSYHLSKNQILSLKLFFTSVTIHGIAQQLGNPKFLSISSIFQTSWFTLPEWFISLTLALMILSALAVFSFSTLTFKKEQKGLPVSVWLMIITTIMIFSFSVDVLKIFWLYVPSFYHGSQYLVVTASLKNKEKNSPVNSLLSEDNIGYWLWVIAIGVAIYIGIPTMLARTGVNLIIAFNTVFWTVNLLHFVIDGFMWRKNWRTG